MQMRAQPRTRSELQSAVCGLLLLVGALTAACKATPAAQRSDDAASLTRAPEAIRGRIIPNLVVIYDPKNDVDELWVRMEIPLDKLNDVPGKDGTEKVLQLLEDGSDSALTRLQGLVLPIMDDPTSYPAGKSPRKAFKEIVRCALLDNIAHAKEPTGPSSCKEALLP